MSKMVEILEVASTWLTTKVTPDDIEHEKQQLEAKYDRQLDVHQTMIVHHSGVPCLRVEWKVI